MAQAARAERIEDEQTHSGRLLLRMPQSLHAELAREAEREGVSLNALITGTLSSAIGWRAPEGSARPAAPRLLRAAIVADLVLVAIAALVAIALLIAAWP